MPTEEERMKVFMDVVKLIPTTWTCVDCGEAFNNTPSGVMPFARRSRLVPMENGDQKQIVVGDICRTCFEK